MPVIVAALSWSWRETEVDPLTGARHHSARRNACSRAASSALLGPRSRRLALTAPVSGSTSVSRQDQLRAATIIRMFSHPLRNTTPSPPEGYVQVIAPSALHT